MCDALVQIFDVPSVPSKFGAMRVTYTDETSEMSRWAGEYCNTDCLGFDTESLAVIGRRRPPPGPSVLQLASGDDVLVARIGRRKCPAALVDVLGDRDVVKVGVGIDDDAIELYRGCGLAVRGRFDLGGCGGTPPQRVALATLARTARDGVISCFFRDRV